MTSKHSQPDVAASGESPFDSARAKHALAGQLARIADAMLGTTTLHRIGRAPKSLRCYRVAEALAKTETPELILADGMMVQVEALAQGQQFVAYGVHPVTGRPYEWTHASPETVPFADVPLVTEAGLHAYLAAAEAVLRAAGGLTKKEREATAAHPVDQPEPVAFADKPKPTRESAGRNAYFREINKRALANIGPWFTGLFPKARFEEGAKTWRVTSADLGRGLEEDISVHPTEGGQDFGTRQSCSPIDLVIEWGGAADAIGAAAWLCDKLGIKPLDCGWKPVKENRERPKREARPASGLPLISVTAGNLHVTTTEAEDALLSAGVAIYQRGRDLVRPACREVPAAKGRTTVAAGLVNLNTAGLVDELCGIADWQRFDARVEDWVRINPPRQVAETLLSRHGRWRLPPVAGVVTTPTMRADGSILDAPGYDPATRLYHMRDPGLTLHAAVRKPTRADAERALKLLKDLLCEFPFVNEVARAVALSALITPVIRGAIPVAPAHAFRANTAGSGKSYLADTSSAIATGRPCPVISAAPGDDAETEKRITGLLLAGFPIVSIDNVNGELGGDLLCQAIERPLVQVRPLGHSDIVEIESRATVFCTGNNLRVRGDMVRRTLVSDLDAGVERPEERQFTGDPVATVLADRSRYVSACLIIVRAYLLAGSPGKLPSIASFEEWSNLVRSALVWLGCADPVLSMKAARDDDPELTELREMIAAWRGAFGFIPTTVRRAVNATAERQGKASDLRYPELLDAITRVAGGRGSIDPARMGKWLLSREGRIVSGLRFKRDGVTDGAARWKLSPVEPPGRG